MSSTFWGIRLERSLPAVTYTFEDDVMITGASCTDRTSGDANTTRAILFLAKINVEYPLCTFHPAAGIFQANLSLKMKKGETVTFRVDYAAAWPSPSPIGITGYVLTDSGEKQSS